MNYTASSKVCFRCGSCIGVFIFIKKILSFLQNRSERPQETIGDPSGSEDGVPLFLVASGGLQISSLAETAEVSDSADGSGGRTCPLRADCTLSLCRRQESTSCPFPVSSTR